MTRLMLRTFNEYFYTFLHPFKLHNHISSERRRVHTMPQLRLAVWGEKSAQVESKHDGLSIIEQVGISWLLVVVRAIYSIISINIGISIYQAYVSNDAPIFSEILSPINLQGQKVLLLYVIGEAALYPVILWFYIKFWSVLIRFFGNLFDCEGDIYEMTEQVIGHSLVGHLFLLIPIFGDVARHFSSVVYIFAGLRANMKMTVLQSVIVICSPLLLIVILFLMAMAYIMALFSVL